MLPIDGPGGGEAGGRYGSVRKPAAGPPTQTNKKKKTEVQLLGRELHILNSLFIFFHELMLNINAVSEESI